MSVPDVCHLSHIPSFLEYSPSQVLGTHNISLPGPGCLNNLLARPRGPEEPQNAFVPSNREDFGSQSGRQSPWLWEAGALIEPDSLRCRAKSKERMLEMKEKMRKLSGDGDLLINLVGADLAGCLYPSLYHQLD